MKIYISTDLEGVTGVFHFGQTREKGGPANREACRMLMHDVAAVAEGLAEAGVDEILAMDGHGGNCSFLPELMESGVRYITGVGASWYGFDETCDGMILLGYHAMNGVADGVLHHTGSSKVEKKVWYDGVERGELFQNAVFAGSYGTPVIMCTGDEALCREARATLGDDVVTVAVKKGINREAAALLAPEETRAFLKAGAKEAVARLPKLKPFTIALPAHKKVRMIDPANSTPENPYYAEWEGMVSDPRTIRELPKP